MYAARDAVLDREVAVKVMHSGQDAGRFVIESKITARLPHPGVPPVYALGTLPDGRPFLAMKVIRGRTLADELRASGRADLPRLLGVFEQVCQTVGFAHARGIIHRDLKPANVMLGAFGEVQVMDWGLAKDLSRDTAADGSEGTAPPCVRPPGAVDTEAGHVMGTPAYMAPEQARGETVDARADVFALGGILAVVLGGTPPFLGTTVWDTVQKARRADLGDCLAAIDVCGADPELIAVARRCLSANAADRPADAQTVAAKVAGYRSGVEARLRQAETDRTRAETQADEQRKRRRVVQWAGGGIAAVLLMGIVGTAIGLFEARRQTKFARNEAEQKETAWAEEARHRGIADDRREAAERAEVRTADVLDAMVSVVTGDSLATQMAISEEQKQFLTLVLPYFREFAAARGDDVKTRVRVARAALRVGLIEGRLGRRQEGAAAFESARDGYARLAAEFPAVPDYRRDLAVSHNNLGILLAEHGQSAGAEEQYRKGLAIDEKLAAEFPAVREYRQHLAGSHNSLGILLAEHGQSAGAEEQYRKGLAIDEKLAAEFPAVTAYQVNLGGSYCNFGILIRDSGDPAESLKWFSRAIDRLQPLNEKEPRDLTVRLFLRNSHWNRALAHDRLQKFAEAVKDWDQAIALTPPAEQPLFRAFRATSRLNAGMVTEAVAEVAEMTQSSKWNASQWYDFACVYAVCSGKIADKKQEYTDRAMELLTLACAAGLQGCRPHEDGHRPRPLRDRADFKTLLADLEKKFPPPPPVAPPPREKK